MNDQVRTRTLELMKKYNVEPQKKFSQNFLFDQGAINSIIKTVPFNRADEIVEIGPGLGSLTFELVEKAKHLTAIDFDRDMVRALEGEIKRDNFVVEQNDFMKEDLQKFHVKHLAYIGNLPYEISRAILRKVACSKGFIYFGFMLQKDLADKLFYQDKNPINNPYSVYLALRGTLTKISDFNPGAFYPPPNISSTFLTLIPSDESLADEATFDFISRVFTNPRKNLNNNLKSAGYTEILSKLSSINISPLKRPHELNLDEWRRLIKARFEK